MNVKRCIFGGGTGWTGSAALARLVGTTRALLVLWGDDSAPPGCCTARTLRT
jgi:hypothetical protein